MFVFCREVSIYDSDWGILWCHGVWPVHVFNKDWARIRCAKCQGILRFFSSSGLPWLRLCSALPNPLPNLGFDKVENFTIVENRVSIGDPSTATSSMSPEFVSLLMAPLIRYYFGSSSVLSQKQDTARPEVLSPLRLSFRRPYGSARLVRLTAAPFLKPYPLTA